VVVDKPEGPTSHDVVDVVRRALGVRRVGHTGTLDPFATGVLAVCVGRATRLARFLAAGVKVYRARVRLGFATTTDDRTGRPLSEPSTVSVDAGAVEVACARLCGDVLQLPPAYSAKRVDGQRLYELAREGVAVERRRSPVHIERITLLECAGETLELEVVCSPGTYIRALARDLGDALGCGGHLSALRRLRSGDLDLAGAVALDAIAASAVRPLDSLLPELPAVHLTAAGVRAVGHGRAVTRVDACAGFPEQAPGRVRLLDEQGRLVALALPRGFEAPVAGLSMQPSLQPDVVLIQAQSDRHADRNQA